MFDMIKNIGPTELLIIVIILIAFFGARAMMGLARTSGETVKEIKKVKKEFTKALEEDEEPTKNQQEGGDVK